MVVSTNVDFFEVTASLVITFSLTPSVSHSIMFLAAMSSSRSDGVTHSVCSSVPKEFFVVIRRFQGVLCRHKTIWRVIGINREVTPAQKEFGCFEGPRMCQGCYTVLLGSCQGCFNGYLKRYIMSVSMVIYGCVSVSRVLHEWIKGISWVCKGCFMSESGIFLECYKGVYWTRNI